MKYQLLLLSLISLVHSLHISNGVLRTKSQELEFSSSPRSSIDFSSSSNDLTIQFDIESSNRPDQIFIKFINENGVESSYKPTSKKSQNGYSSKLSINYNNLPKLFQSSSELVIKLIVASHEDKFFEQIGLIQLSPELVAKSTYKTGEKFQAKQEIIHIFQQPPKQVNSLIAIVFSTLSVITLFVLFVVWGVSGALNLKNFVFDINHIIFLGLIAGYEVVFFQYYLGSSIFSTIGKVFVLLGPSLWFGSKLLNYLGKLRLASE
ncbi:hypothetical protein WICMUC_004245 [Wickerhamomyces mucosus]|uniref:Ribophorin II C-terminal domain-containing protein n=1 Tax=Wickerhamomyces mucosus TaxID=1378264 RepID=A0A9P8TB87_9ASCO|nr:hypothetical protein WICMUC_004245 [Wickerhamomyces mucosus]